MCIYIQSALKFGAGRIKKTQLDREKYMFFNFLEKNHIHVSNELHFHHIFYEIMGGGIYFSCRIYTNSALS